MTEIKLDINIALLMLGKTREEYEEKKKDIKRKDCLFNKKNVEKIHECILSETEKYFGFPLEKLVGFDKKHIRHYIKKLLLKPSDAEKDPQPIILGTVESRPRPSCKLDFCLFFSGYNLEFSIDITH